ncbi:MAG: hypothetical protein U0M42_03570 [Acutalibacteraceae bacterium]|nr:hypothetical protein [Acutalibacteraceae bacterium]
MWEKISLAVLVAEIVLLLFFFLSKFIFTKYKNPIIFILIAFFLNFGLHLIPLFYSFFELKQESNLILEVVDRFGGSLKMLGGETNPDFLSPLSSDVPVFNVTFLFGTVFSVLSSLNAAITVFSQILRNRMRLSFKLNKKECDIVVGTSENALKYAENSPCVILSDTVLDRDTVKDLVDKGYTVLNRNFTSQLLNGFLFNKRTHYNIICFDNKDSCLEYINTYLNCSKTCKAKKNIKLYIEMDSSKAEIIQAEIINNSDLKSKIVTFSADELICRRFTMSNPLTKYLPRTFFEEDSSLKSEATIKVDFIGFGSTNREMYRQCVNNNQFVKWNEQEKTYDVYPVNYSIYDTDISSSHRYINGLNEDLKELKQDDYFPLPTVPFKTKLLSFVPHFSEESEDTKHFKDVVDNLATDKNSYNWIIIDTKDFYQNIKIGAKLRSMLDGRDNYHIFIYSAFSFPENDEHITYWGNPEEIFNHDVVVNNRLSYLAFIINKKYVDKNKNIEKEIKESWEELDHFKRFANTYAAINLKFKLNLLGLDIKKTEDEPNIEASRKLLDEKYISKIQHTCYEDYKKRSTRNAIIAQEHARWNAYYLLKGFMPFEKSKIKVIEKSQEEVDKLIAKNGELKPFDTKKLIKDDMKLKLHACITTHSGLYDLFHYYAQLMSKAEGVDCSINNVECFVYDDILSKIQKGTAKDDICEFLGDLKYEITQL